jgi:hypothetical protein
MAWFTDLETRVYRQARFATYFAKEALVTVFTDNTERSPTFRLYPLDRVQDPERKCWLQVWTEAADLKDAWKKFLGRRFRGLDTSFYRTAFETQVEDPYLREAALRSLASAGNDQELSYDFSFSQPNIERRGPVPGDLGVAVLVDRELHDLFRKDSGFERFVRLHHEKGARVALILVTGRDLADAAGAATEALGSEDLLVHVALDAEEDPLGMRRQIALKMLLNAHSTGIMAALGRVVGNTMTNVSPSNLKLIGRATFLILSHVNDVIARPGWIETHGSMQQVSFAEANAVLFDAIDYVRSQEMGQTAEVALSIIRILETLKRKSGTTWEEARAILDGEGLAAYLQRAIVGQRDQLE